MGSVSPSGLLLNVGWDTTSGSAFHPTPLSPSSAALPVLHSHSCSLVHSVFLSLNLFRSGHKASSLLIATSSQENTMHAHQTKRTNKHTQSNRETESKTINEWNGRNDIYNSEFGLGIVFKKKKSTRVLKQGISFSKKIYFLVFSVDRFEYFK